MLDIYFMHILVLQFFYHALDELHQLFSICQFSNVI